MARRLPPLNSVRAFEAAARHRSFKQAADELCVTPAAVSQQVKSLESYLDQELFIRHGRRELALTKAGELVLPGLTNLFDGLHEIFGRLRVSDGFRVRVMLPPSLATHWLAPRLGTFRRAHPNIELDARVNFDGRTDHARQDLAIYYSPGPFAGRQVDRLMEETVFPVCSPKLLEQGRPLESPEDLRRYTLIHDEALVQVHPRFPTWQAWLNAAGVRGVDTSRGPRVNYASAAIRAAVDGQGIALGRHALVEDELMKGNLVRPLDLTYPETFWYTLAYHPDALGHEGIASVRQWFVEQAQATTQRFLASERVVSF